jgi:23S rRNA pseudouridine1911/1915/1917 synthase
MFGFGTQKEESFQVDVLFEDNDVVVINKPAGVMVHPDGHHTGQTIVDWFLEMCPDAQGVGEPQNNNKGEPLERSGVVHRLDTDTSGVLVLAKHQSAFVHLKAQFHDRHAQKEYRAFVYGPVREKWGTIDKPIGRSPKDFRKRSAMPGAKGTLREATTDWECIGQGRYQDENFSYLKLKPKTGRTHQIRVHLRAIERPVVGDTLYADHMMEISNNLELSRMALHAHVLEIELPSREMQRFIAPVPQSFEEAAERIIGEE